MSNLVGPDYDKPCPSCGHPMGNAAGLGICSRCDMIGGTQSMVISKTVVPFLDGFQPMSLPFIRAPMMKPYRIRTEYSKPSNCLMLIREQAWAMGDGTNTFEEDRQEFEPADSHEVQGEFIEALMKELKDYYHNLMVCCVRADEGGIGIMPMVTP
jgi:hypothetical protein